jgi:hypothetical protein
MRTFNLSKAKSVQSLEKIKVEQICIVLMKAQFCQIEKKSFFHFELNYAKNVQ